MFAVSHEKIREIQENEEEEKSNYFSVIKATIQTMDKFTVDDLKQIVATDENSIQEAVDTLCNMGLVGDIGSSYMVIHQTE